MKPLPTRQHVIETLFDRWTPVRNTEIVEINSAMGRILTSDVYSKVNVPVVRASAMDGIGVDSKMFQNGVPDTSKWKLGREYCRADTGDDFDDQFDAVIAIENVTILEGVLKIDPNIEVYAGMSVRPRGSIIKERDLLVKKHRQLRAFDLASLAMGGITHVEVCKKPKVAFIPTGSELIPLGTPLQRGNNIDSNSVLVRHMLEEMGAEAVNLPIVRDDKNALNTALDKALSQADVVILNGGSSKGAEDYNARILEEKGVALFHWVAAAPGKPLCVALIDNKPVINIPGPPVAVLYVMQWCISAIIGQLLHRPMPIRPTIHATLIEEITAPSDMEILCLMDVKKTATGYYVKQKPWRGEGSMADSLTAGAYYITELGGQGHKPGDILEVTLLRGEEDFA